MRDDVCAFGEQRYIGARRGGCVRHGTGDSVVGVLLAAHRETNRIASFVVRRSRWEVFRHCRTSHAKDAVRVRRIAKDDLLT